VEKDWLLKNIYIWVCFKCFMPNFIQLTHVMTQFWNLNMFFLLFSNEFNDMVYVAKNDILKLHTCANNVYH
jgi:hypothetical protein